MKKLNIFFTIYLVCAIIIFQIFMSCDNNGTTSGGNNFANTSWRSSYGFTADAMVETRLSFLTSSDWAIYAINLNGYQMFAGNYTVSGSTARLMIGGYEQGKATISGNTLTMIGSLATAGSLWIKE